MSLIKSIDWELTETVVGHSSRSLLHGVPGTGKTTCGINVAKREKKTAYSVTLHSDITAQELIGHFVPVDGSFKFHYGPFVRAWLEGAVLIINEICEASGPVMTALYSILDDPEIAMLTLPNGETVRPKKGFKAIATMNGKPESLPDALLDRFEVKIAIYKPHPDAVKTLPKRYHQFVKKMYAGNPEKVTASMRSIIAVHKLTESGLGIEHAFDAVYGISARDVYASYKLTEDKEA